MRRPRPFSSLRLSSILAAVLLLVALGACATVDAPAPNAAPASNTTAAPDHTSETTAPARDSTSADEAPGQEPAARPVTAWELVRGDARVLLFGSIHVGTPDIYPLPPAYQNALEAADRLIVEVAVDQIDQAEYTQIIGQVAYLDGDRTLQDLVDVDDWPTVTAALERYQIPRGNVLSIKPFFLDTTLATLAAAEAGFDSQFGMDLWFLREARSRNMPTLALETASEQLGYLADLPQDVQITSLVVTAEAAVDGRAADDVGRLVEAVTTADIEELESILGEGYDEYPELREIYQLLFVERNRRWADEIDAHTEIAGTSLVVVGAGHLVGDENLREILRSRGYQERQITVTDSF